jgi:hypothetical protein
VLVVWRVDSFTHLLEPGFFAHTSTCVLPAKFEEVDPLNAIELPRLTDAYREVIDTLVAALTTNVAVWNASTLPAMSVDQYLRV